MQADNIPTEELTDEELAQRSCKDDPLVFVVLVNKHSLWVVAYCKRIMGNDSDAEDAAQATWIKVFQNICSFDPRGVEGRFRSWLCKIAYNECMNLLRRKKRQPTFELPENLPSGDQPRDDDAFLERVEAARDCLSRLNEVERCVVQAKVDGIDAKTTAPLCGCTNADAVYQVRHRACSKLRACIERKRNQQ